MEPFQPFRKTRKRERYEEAFFSMPPLPEDLKGPWRIYTFVRGRKRYWNFTKGAMEGVSYDVKEATIFVKEDLLKACVELVGNVYAGRTTLFIESVEG
jgi:hypothetical protein